MLFENTKVLPVVINKKMKFINNYNMSNYINQYEKISNVFEHASNKNDAIRSLSEITYDNGNKISSETAHKIYNVLRKYRGKASINRTTNIISKSNIQTNRSLNGSCMLKTLSVSYSNKIKRIDKIKIENERLEAERIEKEKENERLVAEKLDRYHQTIDLH